MSGQIQLGGITLATESGGVASIDSSVNIKEPLNASGDAPVYACRAWVNFDGNFGTSPFTEENGGIRASGNVSSVTDNGSGQYTVNFTAAMPDANYSVNALSGKVSITYQSTTSTVTTSTISTSGIKVINREWGTNTVIDAEYMFVTIFC